MLREPTATAQTRLATQWMVVNESPTGYAIMQVTGTASALTRHRDRPSAQPGRTLDPLRRALDPQRNPEQIELGLQVIANTAKPVTVGFRGGANPGPCARRW
jgi:hypothetical protein